MALSTRELYLVLRARDEASRTLRGLSGELLRTGAAAAAATERSSAAALRAQAATMAAAGATAAEIKVVKDAAKAHDDEAKAIQNSAVQRQHYANVLSQTGLAMQTVGVGLVVMGGATLVAMGKMVQSTIEYQRQVALTKTQVDGFEASLEDISKVGLQVANTVGTAFEDIQPALFDVFSSTNANLAQAKVLVTAFAKAAVAGQTDIMTASKGTISIMNAFNIPLENVNKVLDVQFQLVRKGRGTYQEFAAVLGNITPSATRAGQSFETVAAMLAFMTRNGLSAAMAATSGARALEAMSHPTTVARLKAMGIEVRDAAGNVRPLTDQLADLRTKINQLPEPDRVKALVELFKGAGGTIQARRFLEQVLLRPGELEEFQGYLKDMQNSTGQFETAYAQMADTVATKSQLLRNRFKVLAEQAGEVLMPYAIKLLDALNELIQSFNNLPKSMQGTIVKVAAAAAIFTVIGGTLMVLIGLLAMVGAALAAAGGTIFIVVGIAAALVIGLMAIGTALVVAYQHSESFRQVIKDLGDDLEVIKGVIGDVAGKMKDAWNEHMSAPISKIANLINEKLLPAIHDLHQMFTDNVIPKVKEAGRIIGDIFGGTISRVGDMINNIIVPALSWLSKQWDANKKYIEPLLPILGQVMKWLLIIAAVIVGVLVAAFIGPLIASVLAVIAVFALLGIAIAKIVQFFKWLWSEIVDIFGAIKDGVITAWNATINFLGNAWEWLKGVFNAGIDWIRARWNQWWNSDFGQLIRAGVGLVVAIVQLLWTSIQFIFQWGVNWIKGIWGDLWPWVHAVFMVAWNIIVNFMSWAWNTISSAVSTGAGNVKGHIVNAWNAVKNLTVDAWNSISSGISDRVQLIGRIVGGIRDLVLGNLKGIGSWLYDAGKSLIEGLVNGITASIKTVTSAIDKVTSVIKDHLPHSPVKRGPLTVLNNGRAGKAIVSMIADGMLSGMNSLPDVVTSLAGQMFGGDAQGRVGGLPVGPLGAPVGQSVTNVFQQTFNVTTQEIDPRKHSADLGWEMQAVMT